MNFKRNFIRITLISSVIIFLVSFQKLHNSKKEQLTFTALFDKWDTINNVTYLSIKTVLTNNSSDTFTYIVMSCFYPFEYTTDKKIFVDEPVDCAKNFPEYVKISPHKSIERIIKLPIKKNFGQSNDTSFRIGVALETSNDIIDRLNKRKKNIVMNTTQKYGFQLQDTSLRVSMKIDTIDNYGIFKQFDTSTDVDFLWSNEINIIMKPS